MIDRFKSGSEEWETPDELFKAVDDEFHFTLDAAATNLNRKCGRWFDKAVCGLGHSWAGHVVWCNPPYGRDLHKWVKKAYLESKLGPATVVMLIPVRTSSKYWFDFIHGKAEVRYLRPVTFKGAKHSLRTALALVIFKSEVK